MDKFAKLANVTRPSAFSHWEKLRMKLGLQACDSSTKDTTSNTKIFESAIASCTTFGTAVHENNASATVPRTTNAALDNPITSAGDAIADSTFAPLHCNLSEGYRSREMRDSDLGVQLHTTQSKEPDLTTTVQHDNARQDAHTALEPLANQPSEILQKVKDTYHRSALYILMSHTVRCRKHTSCRPAPLRCLLAQLES